MDQLEIARVLQAYNPWWTGKTTNPISTHYRRDFHRLKKVLAGEEQKTIVISGPRQVGKTTLVRQLIQSALDEKMENGKNRYEPKRIMYATPELIATSDNSKKTLPGILTAYARLILEESLTSVTKDTLIFLDEVQMEQDWAETIKPYLDSNPTKLKFVVTGSSRLNLIENSAEKLPGRYLPYVLLPLKFGDRLEFNHPELPDYRSLFLAEGGMRETLINSLKSGDAAPPYEQAAKIILSIGKPMMETINEELKCHLQEGGYPQIVLLKDVQTKYEIFKTYISDISSKDLEHSRKPHLAQKLLINLAKYNAQKMIEHKIRDQTYGGETGSPATIQAYLDYLEQLAIIRRVYKNKGNKNIRQRKPKIYFADTGLRNSMIGYLEGELSSEEEGLLAETVALDHLLRFLFKVRGHANNVYFHQKDDQGKEVDFVVRNQLDEITMGVEVKYRDNHVEEINELRKLKEEKPAMLALVLTKDILKVENEKILYLPLWLFLLTA